MIEAAGIVKSFGARKLFGPVDLRVNAGDRVALVGPNGSGKTTLLRILAGEEAPDAGELRGRKGLAVGYLPQELDVTGEGTLLAFVEDVADEIQAIREELRALEANLSEPEALARYGALQTRFETLGGYRLRSEAKKILSGLGFAEGDGARPLASFSGGWRMRALLARILLRAPDLILLDEPTNHLDIVSLEWLETFLQTSKAAFVLVSHDVSFLTRIANAVLSLEPGEAVVYKGGFEAFARDRDARREQQRAEHDRYLRKRAEEERFIERFRSKNTKARQVQSRLRRLEKEEAPEAPPEEAGARPAIRFPQPERSGKEVVRVEGVTLRYSDAAKPIYEGLDFTLHRGEKAALIGPNGAGKSTLLKLLAGVLSPTAGRVTLGYNVTISYFSQHQMELLHPRHTVLEEILTLPGFRSEREARSLLGGFLFSGDAVEKKVEVLSGGEKSRLVMARLLCAPGNLLLLDEPTNHLDIDACAVLRDALAAYDGTVAFITHDRDLINHVATQVVYVDGGGYTIYPGNFDDYLRLKGLAAPQPAAAPDAPDASAVDASKGKEARRRSAQQRQFLKSRTGPLRNEVERLEAAIAAAEARLAEVEHLMTLPEVYGNPERAAPLARERGELSRALDESTARWAEKAEELEELTQALLAEAGDG